MMDASQIAKAARECGATSWALLADDMGMKDSDEFRKEVLAACPEIESYFRFRQCCREASGTFDKFMRHQWKYDAIQALVAFLKGKAPAIPVEQIDKLAAEPPKRKPRRMSFDLGCEVPVSEPEEPQKKAEGCWDDSWERVADPAVPMRPSKGLKKDSKKGSASIIMSKGAFLRPCPPEDVESVPMRDLILGYSEETYMGRPIVVIKRSEGGVFGCPPSKRSNAVGMTLHKGVLNHCEMRTHYPSPYWAVMDEMSDRREAGFAKCEIVAAASKRCGGGAEKACEIAFNVLRGHHNHPRKRSAGLSHMVEYVGPGREMMTVRGRTSEETLQYFESMKSGKIHPPKEVPKADVSQEPVAVMASAAMRNDGN